MHLRELRENLRMKEAENDRLREELSKYQGSLQDGVRGLLQTHEYIKGAKNCFVLVITLIILFQ